MEFGKFTVPQGTLFSDDAECAYLDVIRDLGHLRDEIMDIWLRRLEGELDTIAAAVATKTAIELARELIDDGHPLFKNEGGLTKMALRVFETEDDEEINDDPDVPPLRVPYDLITTLQVLQRFQALLKEHQEQGGLGLPDFDEAEYTENPLSDCMSDASASQFAEDHILLEMAFREGWVGSEYVYEYPVQDALLQEMKEMCDNPTLELPFHLVFTAQIFLDVHHFLRDTIGNGLTELREVMNDLREELKLHHDFHHGWTIPDWHHQDQQDLCELENKIARIERIERMEPYSLPTVLEEAFEHRLLSHWPVLAGLINFKLRCDFHEIGLKLARAVPVIGIATYLYNALETHTAFEQTARWTSMDYFQRKYGGEHFYHDGQRPSNSQNFFRQWCTMRGCRPGDALNLPLGANSRLYRGKPVALFSVMFSRRFVGNPQVVQFTKKHIDEFVSLGLWTQLEKPDIRPWEGILHTSVVGFFEGLLELEQVHIFTRRLAAKTYVTALSAQKRQSKRSKKKAKILAKNKAKKEARTRPQLDHLVRGIAVALHHERSKLACAFMPMQRHCWSMLEHVRGRCDGLLREMIPSADLNAEIDFPMVVHCILKALANQDDEKNVELVAQAAAAVHGFVPRDIFEKQFRDDSRDAFTDKVDRALLGIQDRADDALLGMQDRADDALLGMQAAQVDSNTSC